MPDQQPHTPSTAEIRNAVTRGENDWREADAQFDRWLQERDARIEAAAEQRGAARAWDEGWNAGYFDYVEMIGNDDYQPQNNPYRADQIEGDDETH